MYYIIFSTLNTNYLACNFIILGYESCHCIFLIILINIEISSFTRDKSVIQTFVNFCFFLTFFIRGDYPFELGDIVSIKARYDSDTSRWCVDDNNGFIIKHPDILVTGTTIVGSLFCRRQAVLNYLFPGVDSKNSSMLVGSLVHELLQDVRIIVIQLLDSPLCVLIISLAKIIFKQIIDLEKKNLHRR